MIISALERQEDLEFKSNLGYTVSLSKQNCWSAYPLGSIFPIFTPFSSPKSLWSLLHSLLPGPTPFKSLTSLTSATLMSPDFSVLPFPSKSLSEHLAPASLLPALLPPPRSLCKVPYEVMLHTLKFTF